MAEFQEDLRNFLNRYINDDTRCIFSAILDISDYNTLDVVLKSLVYHFITIEDLGSLDNLTTESINSFLKTNISSYSFLIQDEKYNKNLVPISEALLYNYNVAQVIQKNNSETNRSLLVNVKDFSDFLSKAYINQDNNDIPYYFSEQELRDEFNLIFNEKVFKELFNDIPDVIGLDQFPGIVNSALKYLREFIFDDTYDAIKLFMYTNLWTSKFMHNESMIFYIINLYSSKDLIQVQTKKLSIELSKNEKLEFSKEQLTEFLEYLKKMDLTNGNYITNIYYTRMIILILLADSDIKLDPSDIALVKSLNNHLEEQFIKLQSIKEYFLEIRKQIKNKMKVV